METISLRLGGFTASGWTSSVDTLFSTLFDALCAKFLPGNMGSGRCPPQTRRFSSLLIDCFFAQVIRDGEALDRPLRVAVIGGE